MKTKWSDNNALFRNVLVTFLSLKLKRMPTEEEIEVYANSDEPFMKKREIQHLGYYDSPVSYNIEPSDSDLIALGYKEPKDD